MPRIQEIAKKFGLSGDSFSAEDVLKLAALSREQKTGTPTVGRFLKWEHLMSSAEGNDEYRNADEVARRVYIQEIQKLIDGIEDDEEKQRFISLISKLGDSQVRVELDKDLSVAGVDIDEDHQRVQNKIEDMGTISYRDYLQQENRWSGGDE